MKNKADSEGTLRIWYIINKYLPNNDVINFIWWDKVGIMKEFQQAMLVHQYSCGQYIWYLHNMLKCSTLYIRLALILSDSVSERQCIFELVAQIIILHQYNSLCYSLSYTTYSCYPWCRGDLNPRQWRLEPKSSALDHSATTSIIITCICHTYITRITTSQLTILSSNYLTFIGPHSYTKYENSWFTSIGILLLQKLVTLFEVCISYWSHIVSLHYWNSVHWNWLCAMVKFTRKNKPLFSI